MTFSFGSQKNDPIYGSYGEFTVGSEKDRVRAQFVLTKMKPGSEGGWENLLASQMVPWREIFKIEELTFDELLQRDLDDSRVAHELIPYLLGNENTTAKFFPPILAVLVPKNTQKSGIQPYYPEPTIDETTQRFGDLFDFEKLKFEGGITPLSVIRYNRQKTSFVIVDGQHRAMAVLALHRQINSAWGADRYASFYNHLSVDSEQVSHIELPVCIIFFPDLHERNEALKSKDIDLKKICREIFLVVNKSAKKVSRSRELLLDDEDIAARMMRSTLSKLKGRGEDAATVARIYSFAFGDADADLGKQVVAGKLEYSSAVALYKMHAAISFCNSKVFGITESIDITDLRRLRNSDYVGEIFVGTRLEHLTNLSRLSGKRLPPDDISLIVRLLSELVDDVLLPLFDKFRPFSVHNSTLRELRTRLLDPDARADLTQSKCYSLLFEGSGVRYVYEQHRDTLKEKSEEAINEGRSPSDYVVNQLKDANAVLNALDKHEETIKAKRACKLFSIDYQKFFSLDGNENQKKELLSRAKTIFDTVSTQAFQLGYLMAVHSVANSLIEPGIEYDERLSVLRFVENLYLNALNKYFASDDSEHRTLTGLISEARAKVFDQNQLGLRGLLSLSVKEINERQWTFFRYAILEMVHCKHSYNSLLNDLEVSSHTRVAQAYREYLPQLTKDIVRLREQYVESAIQSALDESDFKIELQTLRARLIGEQKYEDEIAESLEQKNAQKRQEVSEKCENNIHASLGEYSKAEKLESRLIETASVEQ